MSKKNSVSVVKNILLAVSGLFSSIILISPEVSPETFWICALLTFLIFPVVVAHTFLVPLLVYKKSWYAFVSVVILLMGLFYLSRVYVISFGASKDQQNEAALDVLSYNTSFFRAGRVFSKEYYSPEYHLQALNTRNWILGQSPDIICLQEFFDDVNSNIFDNVKFFEQQGKYEAYFMAKPLHNNGTRRGIITFSRFPIINHKEIFLAENRYNGAICTDLLIGTDTIRIINVHLASLNLFSQKNLSDLLTDIKKNILLKAKQCNIVLEEIRSSPYRVIVCGDFNEMPLSYTYTKLNEIMNNAFEEAGGGLGGTLSGKKFFPYLRIDHQFVNPDIKVKEFKTYHNISFSDHYPIRGSYQVTTGKE